MEISINSINELNRFASKLSGKLKPGAVILLVGEMGSGKTSFVQAFAKSLGINEFVKSPTFIIHNEYNSKNGLKIHHLDLYRLTGSQELNELKITDSLTANSYIFIEWADKFEKELTGLFPNIKKYKLEFKIVDENRRLVELTEL